MFLTNSCLRTGSFRDTAICLVNVPDCWGRPRCQSWDAPQRTSSLAGHEPWPASQEIHLGMKTWGIWGSPTVWFWTGNTDTGAVGAVSTDSGQQSLPPVTPAPRLQLNLGGSVWLWPPATLCQSQAWPLGGLEDSALLAWSPGAPAGDRERAGGSGGDTAAHRARWRAEMPLLIVPGGQPSHWLNAGTGITPHTSRNENNCPVNPWNGEENTADGSSH